MSAKAHRTGRYVRSDSLLHRVRTFFEENPGEELTQQQIVVKFGANLTAVRNVMWALTKQGALRRDVVYRREDTA